MQVGGPPRPSPLPLTDWSAWGRARWRGSGQGARAARPRPESERELRRGHSARAPLGATRFPAAGRRLPPPQRTGAQGAGEVRGDRAVFLGLPERGEHPAGIVSSVLLVHAKTRERGRRALAPCSGVAEARRLSACEVGMATAPESRGPREAGVRGSTRRAQQALGRHPRGRFPNPALTDSRGPPRGGLGAPVGPAGGQRPGGSQRPWAGLGGGAPVRGTSQCSKKPSSLVDKSTAVRGREWFPNVKYKMAF